MTKTALILIDIQNDYFSSLDSAKFPLVGMEAATSNAAKILAIFREKQQPIIHVRHVVDSPEAPFFIANTEGAEIHQQVTPQGDEPVVTKHFPNSFRETNLQHLLDAQGITDLLIVGAMSQNCVDSTTRAAVDLGYRCAIAHDACATLDLVFNGVKIPAEHVQGAYMAALGWAFANVDSTENHIIAIREQHATPAHIIAARHEQEIRRAERTERDTSPSTTSPQVRPQ